MTALLNDAASSTRFFANHAFTQPGNGALETVKLSRYVRGQLIDVSSIARDAGLRVPTVFTAAVWQQGVSDIDRPVDTTDVRQHEETIWQIVRDVQKGLRQSPGRARWDVTTLSKADCEGRNYLFEVRVHLDIGVHGETVLVISDPADLFV